jgi:hypothetical protein
MTRRRETLSRLIDSAQAKADRALARGQFRAAWRHQERVAFYLAAWDAA